MRVAEAALEGHRGNVAAEEEEDGRAFFRSTLAAWLPKRRLDEDRSRVLVYGRELGVEG